MKIIFYLIDWIIHTYVLVILIRFLGHVFGLPYSNQVMNLMYNLTRYWSVPLRKVFPVIYGCDTSLLLFAYGLLLLSTSLPLLVGAPVSGMLFVIPLVQLFSAMVDIFFFSIIIGIIVSFLAPGLYHPITQVVYYLTEPLLRPVRQLIPPISGFDLSPIPVLMALKACEMLLISVVQ